MITTGTFPKERIKISTSKWHLHRAGLLNFWYYDEEEFHFADGKLLFRGDNGSGKSVTMQSFIPLLLDGHKSPERLDPFGSRARKMEDYLLGEKEIVDRDERTGYLYLEYKREGIEQYLTTGIGLRAKRAGNIDFWGFVITDNRRIGKNFLLYKMERSLGKEEKIPLSRIELENRLADGGKVVRTNTDYMDLVNKHIFGFENIADFGELIKLLIQLRSPKLSKDFKPTVIYEILNESLPGLSEDELRPLSETIENMDQIQQQIKQLMDERNSLTKLCKQYDDYNQLILFEKAQGYLESHTALHGFYTTEKKLEADSASLGEETERLEARKSELLRENEVLQEEKSKLEKHEVFDLESEKIDLEHNLRDKKAHYVNKEKNLHKQKVSEQSLKLKIDGNEHRLAEIDQEISSTLDDLDHYGEETRFFSHSLAKEEFAQKYRTGEFVFDLWKKETTDYREQLTAILKAIEKLDKAQADFRAGDKELAEAHKDADLNEAEAKKWKEQFAEEKGGLTTAFYDWMSKATELILDESHVQKISRICENLLEEYTINNLKEIINQRYLSKSKSLGRELASLEQEKLNYKEQIATKEDEIKEWQSKKDPEPPRHQDTISTRQELDAKRIPYLPFYRAVEFKPEVTPEQRERLESAITRMGILDALILPEKYLDKAPHWDNVLSPAPYPSPDNLADLLVATPNEGNGVSAATIVRVLQSISLEETAESGAVIRDDGTYQMALLRGEAPREETSLFIGQEARREYRQKTIARLEEELRELEKLLSRTVDKLHRLKDRQRLLTQELDNLPTVDDVQYAYDEWQQLVSYGKILKSDLDKKNEMIRGLRALLETRQEELKGLTVNIDLPQSSENYETAVNNIHHYQGKLHKLELEYRDYLHTTDNLKNITLNLEETIERVDELQGEINVITAELKKLELQFNSVKERLQLSGAEEVKARISEVKRRIEQYPQNLLKTENKLTTNRNSIEFIKSELEKVKLKQRVYGELHKHWEKTLTEELKLELVKDAPQWDPSLELTKLAGELNEALDIKENATREKLSERLTRIFYEEQGDLIEYRLTQQPVAELEVKLDLTSLDQDRPVIQSLANELMNKSRRNLILLEYSGSKVSPFFVLEKIDGDIRLQQEILNDKDKELYEEIIMNSVGLIIRARINRAESWVAKIDQLMAERNTSSGLNFSLRWRPLTAQWEEELDTKELVDLLRLDPKFLKPSDMDNITKHFRSKISRAKELMEEKGYGETFNQIIGEMLDYRQWFQFTLYYQKTGERKKELTNRAFDIFSGGEKAMAMYVPLFSAAYSRYQEAGKDAPYIISLDEAFAGVDETNISDMFDLAEKLEFNYIMNSQSLWGDYDTVSALSICELVRPKNAPYVAVIRYWWNGRKKELLAPGKYRGELKETVAGV